jgi:predicted transcriptional regulator YdeE
VRAHRHFEQSQIFWEPGEGAPRILKCSGEKPMKMLRTAFFLVPGLAALLAIGLPMLAGAQSKPSPVVAEMQPGFTVVGFPVRTDNKQEAGGTGQIAQLWQRVAGQDMLAGIPHRADANTLAVYTNYASDQNGEYTYVLGVRVTAVDKVPDGMVALTIPAGKYAVITSDTGSLPDVIPQVWRRINAMPVAEMGGQRAFKTDFEIYPENFDWQNAQITVHLGLKPTTP